MNSQFKQHALTIFQAGVAAADPYQAVRHYLSLAELGNDTIHLLAFGKAACAMSSAAIEMIPASPLANQGIAVTNYENVKAVDRTMVYGAGHPLPNNDGFYAAQKIVERAKLAKENECLLVLISGGGSALLPCPTPDIRLEDKISTTNLLLASGATINEINCVRKHLSQLKGGGLAKLAYPAKVYALILSDVIDDDLSSIASGCTVPDQTTYNDAITILKHYSIWHTIPESIRQHLLQGKQGFIAETPKVNDSVFKHNHSILCGSNRFSLKATQQTAEQLGYKTHIYSEQLCGIAKEQAEKLAIYASTINPKQAIALLAGGETTVNVTGSGKGGRNQEFALAFAISAEKVGLKNWTLLSGGTDGRDGPTDAAGGLVNEQTLTQIRQAGLNPVSLLNNNDAYNALQATNDLLITGATGTNVADLQILLLHP